MNFRLLGALLKKDLLCLLPLVAGTTLLFAADVFLLRFELIAQWPVYRPGILPLTATVLVLAVVQLDAPASLVDDWLCRPVPRSELIVAKLSLLLAVFYLSRVLAVLVADLMLGRSLAESLLDAVLLQDDLFLILLPILLILAAVTQSLVQGIGVLVALFVCIFVLPTAFVQDPGPLDPAIGDEMVASGMGWLAHGPAKIVAVSLMALVFWLVYGHRRIGVARAMLPSTTLVICLLVVAPMYLLPWSLLYAAQTTFTPATPRTPAPQVKLHGTQVCFPSARLADLATDPTFNAAHPLAALRLWADSSLATAGPEAIGFQTELQPVGLPADWRTSLLYVQANYQGEDENSTIALRPVAFITDRNGGSTLSHTWALPDSQVRALKNGSPTLRLEYSLALLAPREYRVRTDGRRQELPGLGYCSARVDAAGNRIEVDCFSAFGQPEQISAELDGIPASRVLALPDLSPRWSRWIRGGRVQLEIASPRLAKHDTITVTAWRLAGYLQEGVTLPGILGADLATCPLPQAGGSGFQKARWRDAAPHEPYSILVDEGVQVEVLDFGGTGSPIVLLPGLGATAHSFDDLAPELAKKHRVIAITRRGAGASSKPDFGFETPRLARDVLEVMDRMELRKVLLVGSSIAGDELTWLGGHHPDRFHGLVYLDAAYDRSIDRHDSRMARLRELNRRLPPEPPIPPQARLNYQALSAVMAARGHAKYPEGELIALLRMNQPLVAGSPSIDARTQQAISAAIETPDYAAVRIPALAIYAFENPDARRRPWHGAEDVPLLDERARILADLKRASIEQFRRGVARGEVLELANASHHVALSNPREVLDAIETFSGKLGP